jgi:hypothetical protein
MSNEYARRLRNVAIAFGCAPYVVGASSGWVPEPTRRRVPGCNPIVGATT